MKKRLTCTAAVVVVSCLFIFPHCGRKEKPSAGSYLNLSDTVAYVGMQTCRGCHAHIYESYIRTGMGSSFGPATPVKSAAEFHHLAVYDSIKNFYYQPFWKEDSLFVLEYRLRGKDTIYARTERIDFIIGSGQHTNSHICSFNGYLYQAPITFYTQRKTWDLAPGFSGGFNSRFSRPIEMECMSCHNGLPQMEAGSVNKYALVPMGIDCERCHGPGGEHVRQKQNGIRVDTSRFTDYSIVNPARLTKELQMSLCQRCHLQGLAILRKGKSFSDFKPGMHLSEVMDVFLPESQHHQDKFIMASQAQRLRMSKCYQQSQMTCITCHNPHVSVKETPREVFNSRCISCHPGGKATCPAVASLSGKEADNCIGCHMPRSGSIDIPHVSITDHFIRKNYASADTAEIDAVADYLRLKCYTQPEVSASVMARAYLEFYEKFSPRGYLLDSAQYYLSRDTSAIEEKIHYYFLQGNFEKVVQTALKLNEQSSAEPWTYYRIGEAHYQLGNYRPAYDYFLQANAKLSFYPDFQNKLAAALIQLGRYDEAKDIYHRIIVEQPKFESAWCNLGYLLMREGNYERAKECLDKALSLNPDHELSLTNRLALALHVGAQEQVTEFAERLQKVNPHSPLAAEALQRVSGMNNR
ncbi:MAG: hypothetical protein KatS3mg031_0410 [Chitinophagales bacterium]|nr:MAG: hypothetical protein KatS3mg031_0410 [Chitinophagales bacterium]